jgi:hypothetical protein
MSGEEFLREYNFDETVVPQEDAVIFGMQPDTMQRFTECLERRLVITDEKSMVQSVVMAALEVEGLELKHPEMITEAVLANPEMKAEALGFVESILNKNLQ